MLRNDTTPNLQKRIFNYSLTAAAILAGTGTANAQVWGFDVDPDAVLSSSGQSLNINFNGNVAFNIKYITTGTSTHNYLYIISEKTASAQWIKRGLGRPKPLSSSYVISASAAAGWANNNNYIAFVSEFGSFSGGSFFGAGKYIGVRFKISGSYHYGWILVNIAGDASSGMTIKSYAYEQTAGDPITANGSLPVELNSFSAKLNSRKVELAWKTATEKNNYGFEIQRLQDSKIEKLKDWMVVGFVDGHGNSNSTNNYRFVDNNPPSGKLSYRLKQIDTDGKFTYHDIVEVNTTLPTKMKLFPNYPNPFNPTTKIRYQIPAKEFVTLKVYDMLGKEAATLVNEVKEAGEYNQVFDASELPSGTYFYTLTAGSFTETKKLLLLK